MANDDAGFLFDLFIYIEISDVKIIKKLCKMLGVVPKLPSRERSRQMDESQMDAPRRYVLYCGV